MTFENRSKFLPVTWALNAMGYEAIPTYVYTNQSQKGNASQLEAMSLPYPADNPTATRASIH